MLIQIQTSPHSALPAKPDLFSIQSSHLQISASKKLLYARQTT